MADHDAWATAPTPSSEPSVEARLAALEARIAQQEAELMVLRAGRATDATAPVHPDADAPAAPATTAPRGRKGTGARSSRRALLKLGGAAAAAGVAAAAAGATELGHPGTALAASGVFDANGSGLKAVQADGTNSAFGVYATTDSATAVVGGVPYPGTGTGVSGVAQSGTGVAGSSASGYGVWGVTGIGTAAIFGDASSGPSSTGVWGIGGGHGVTGNSPAGRGGAFSGGLVPLYLQPGGSAGAPPDVGYAVGDVYVDNTGALFIHTTTGWVRLTGVQSGAHGGAISYLGSPIRLLDARTSPGSALVTRGPLAGNETYAFTVAGLGGSGIPANAQGLFANVTVLGPSGVGNLSLFPAPGPGPSVASMTFGTPGLFLANGVNVAIGTAGQIMIQNQSNGTTPLVLDAVAFVS
jgi:hypothetical protein